MATRKLDAVPAPQRGRKLTLSFGMVSVPVHFKPFAETVRPVSGTGICPEHGPALKQTSVCSAGTPNEHYLENGDKAFAYPHPDDPDRLVVVDRDVFKQLEERTDGSAKITSSVDVDAIDPCFFEKTYLVWPQAGAEEAFDLFAAVLDAEKRAAVVTTVLSKQTQTVIVRWSAELGCVLAHAINFTERLRHYEAKLVRDGAKQRDKVAPEALDLAKQFFATIEGEFDAGEVEDKLTVLKQDAIRAAAKGKSYTPPKADAAPAPTGDIMAALRASVDAAGAPVKKASAKRAPAKRAKKVAA